MFKNKLMQLFKDNAELGKKDIKAEEDGTEATMYLYDAIGDWYGVGAKDFAKELSGLSAETLHLRINTPGGDVFEARAMATALKQCGMKVIAHVDGLCASAGTYIALACDEVEMAEGGFFMAHKGWTMDIGNADDFRKTADLLDKVDQSIIKDYATKTGKGADELEAMMAAETWFSAEEALAYGFIDRVAEEDEGKKANKWNLSAYSNVPEGYSAPEIEGGYDRERFERRLSIIEAGI